MKIARLEYGSTEVAVEVPDEADILGAGRVAPLGDPAAEVRSSLEEPTGTPALRDLARGRSRAAVVVSDNTRPVPYRGPSGILAPVITVLKEAGVGRIDLIVASGTHRPLSRQELESLLDPAAFQDGVEVVNHVGTDDASLRMIGSTARTPRVTVNRRYLDADLKILTGLVEPHFMAGFSGGRKAVCPGICGREVTHGFHSGAMHEDERSASLVMEGNPCHEESLEIARMAGADFIINATIDSKKRMTGVFAGDLEKAHAAAVAHVRSFAEVPVEEACDVVVTHGGYVGINHYQCAKAAVEASRVVRSGGAIVLVACLTEPDPVGSSDYLQLLGLLARLGPRGYRERILSRDWTFMPEQWEPQMWAKVFNRLGSAGRLFICAPRLKDVPAGQLPETNVAAGSAPREGEDDPSYAARMVRETLERLGARKGKSMIVLTDGPYGVPVLKGERR